MYCYSFWTLVLELLKNWNVQTRARADLMWNRVFNIIYHEIFHKVNAAANLTSQKMCLSINLVYLSINVIYLSINLTYLSNDYIYRCDYWLDILKYWLVIRTGFFGVFYYWLDLLESLLDVLHRWLVILYSDLMYSGSGLTIDFDLLEVSYMLADLVLMPIISSFLISHGCYLHCYNHLLWFWVRSFMNL